MRYLAGAAAFLIFGAVAWIWPPDTTPAHDPLVSSGTLGFALTWMVFLIPLGATTAILAGAWLAFSAGMAKMAKAQRPKVPKSVSYSPHYRSLGPTAPALPAPQPPTIDVTPAAVAVPSFSQLIDRGMIAQGQPLILGYTERGILTGSWKDLYSAAVAGLSGSGKTSTLRFLAAQSALHGARFVVLDPHAGAGQDSLAETLHPLRPSLLCEPASDAASIIDATRLVQAQLSARIRGNPERTPLIVYVDEFSTLVRDDRIANPLGELLESIAQQGRKVDIFALIAGHIWTGSRTHGTPLRDSLAACYVHRLRRQQARMLLSTDEARMAESLDIGQALLLRTNGDCERVALPLATPADVERVGSTLATPVQPLRNVRAIEDNASGRYIRTVKEAQVISMLQDGATVPEVVKALYGETGKAYSDGVREVSRIVGDALKGV